MDGPPDPRLEYLGNYIQKTMKLKSEKWSRLLATDDLKAQVVDWLDHPDPPVLIVMQVLYFIIISRAHHSRCCFRKLCRLSGQLKISTCMSMLYWLYLDKYNHISRKLLWPKYLQGFGALASKLNWIIIIFNTSYVLSFVLYRTPRHSFCWLRAFQ